MTNQEISNKLNESDYDFLRNDPRLGNNIILLGLSGSYGYGMNTETSDLDIRGIALNSKSDILLSRDYETIVENNTDTTIFSFNKIIELFEKSNPNTIEILGLRPEHYLFKTKLGDEIISKRKMFLSKVAIHTFAGYAESQLRRLENKCARDINQSEREKHILSTIENAKYAFMANYADMGKNDTIKLFIDKSNQPDFDTEIFMDINLDHYPLRDWAGMWNEMKSIVSSYNKMGRRNTRALEHGKLGKHMAHLLRLYMMIIDILEKEEIITYREEEHDLLMDIRNGKYLSDNNQPIKEFYEILDYYVKRFRYAVDNTSLPDKPRRVEIDEFKMYVNECVVKGEI